MVHEFFDIKEINSTKINDEKYELHHLSIEELESNLQKLFEITKSGILHLYLAIENENEKLKNQNICNLKMVEQNFIFKPELSN